MFYCERIIELPKKKKGKSSRLKFSFHKQNQMIIKKPIYSTALQQSINNSYQAIWNILGQRIKSKDEQEVGLHTKLSLPPEYIPLGTSNSNFSYFIVPKLFKAKQEKRKGGRYGKGQLQS